jgi:hypothetical protein
VASLSAIGRVGPVVAGAAFGVTGVVSPTGAADGATAGAAVPARTGSCEAPPSPAGGYTVPHAAAMSATSKRLAKTLFMALCLTTLTARCFVPASLAPRESLASPRGAVGRGHHRGYGCGNRLRHR